MDSKKFRHKCSEAIFSESSDSTQKRKRLKSFDSINFYTETDDLQQKYKKEDKKDKKEENIISKSTLDTRLDAINDFANNSIDKNTIIEPTIYLPKHMKKLAILYKTIVNVYNYNIVRKLNVIFEYHKDSIERISKHTCTLFDLEKLKFLCKENIQFKKCNFKGKETFNIIVVKEQSIENVLYKYLKQKHAMWLLDNNVTDKIKGFHKDFNTNLVAIERANMFEDILNLKTLQLTEEDNIKKQMEMILQKNRHKEAKRREEFIQKEVEKIKEVPEEKENTKNIKGKSSIQSEYDSILERIKQKENERRMLYIEKEKGNVKIIQLVKEIFTVEDKNAIKTEDLIFRLNNEVDEQKLFGILKNNFTHRKINGVSYVVKAKSQK